ncbi:MAG: RNA polymerase sigma factor [Prolixibacteraceae bacterium]|nr:RNA polymerase sigma factor [Prolixibacteraceae bacterium]
MNDRQLIKEILKNNNLAFRSLTEKYQKLVYSTAFRLIKNQADAEDIFQEVFLEVFRSCQFIKNDEDLTMWIYKITYNKSISFLRKKNPAKAQNEPDEFHSIKNENKLIERNTPSKLIEQQEAEIMLFRFIDELPENQKKVLLMHKFEGFSQKEICNQMNLSPTSIESLMYRAKMNLKKKLKTYLKHNS